MENFNRGGGNRSGGRRGYERRGFNDSGSRGPAQMFQAVCATCGKSCEVPFRPTNGKPVYCSSCFEGSRGSDSNRPMFDAICDECGNSCKVPFQPRGDKPIYCSNCFGEKKGAGSRESEPSQSQAQPQFREQFEALNNKLDKILSLLNPSIVEKIEEVGVEPIEPVIENVIEVEKETKVAKKRSSKKS